ncbi:uncharacterized protein LOC131673935 isoform X2 [Phymastichus coffea]|uniref:uncharacterized protein LOC131673935 isoform X2 n=1 Tax=Phymastichus coffea TaxID=108790 RepID=UPI00273BB406|nr:uncharacterized protein LOC131673935 isoform X2 [Phymastichus coffea]
MLLVVLLVAIARAQGLSTIASEELQNPTVQLQDFSSGCYFSAEYQGEFVMQVSSGNSIGNVRGNLNTFDDGEPIVQYSTINITFNAIPVWGYCHKKIADKVLLRDSRGGYGECMRCFQLIRRSRNIVEVFSQDLNRCYTNESGAIESCKQLNTSAILYRSKEIGGIEIRNEYCPIAGKYRFKYSVNYEFDGLDDNNSEGKDECTAFSSDMNNCPDGSLLHLKFKRCTFEDHEVSFECLGSWPASSSDTSSEGPRYVALLDNRGVPDFAGPAKWRRPRYRCGLYHVDSRTSRIYLTLSSDSSCNQNLYNSTTGYESLILSKTTTQKKIPPYVIKNLQSFPQWAQGEWQETLIVNGTMTFNDLNGYKSFTFVTVDSNDETGQYIVFSRDQCEQEAYICLIMKQRSENVLEFAAGTFSLPVYQPYLCNDTNDLLEKSSAAWWTLSRLERTVESPCPITGEYTGEIIDIPGWCAELSSNCNTRQVMYYKVYNCNSGELYEERTYLCLGQWEEKGVTYSYTMRNDTSTNECFVGNIISDDEIYIKEAGDSCLRNIDPRTEGMRLSKKGHCFGNSSSPAPTIPTTTTTSTQVPIMKITTPIKSVATRLPTTMKSNEMRKGRTTTERMPPVMRSSSDTLWKDKLVILGLVFIFTCTINSFSYQGV